MTDNDDYQVDSVDAGDDSEEEYDDVGDLDDSHGVGSAAS